MTYLLLNLPFLVIALAVLLVARRRTGRPGWAGVGLTLAVMLVLTAVFDNVMIRVGLVAYDDAQRWGPQVGVAPVEDFAYTVAAVLALPALWTLLGAAGRIGRSTRTGSSPRGRGDGPTSGTVGS